MPCRVDLLRLRMHGFRSNENRTTAQNQRYCTRLLNNQRSEADCTTPETLPSVCKRLLKMTLCVNRHTLNYTPVGPGSSRVTSPFEAAKSRANQLPNEVDSHNPQPSELHIRN